MAMGVKMAMMIIHGSGLLMSPLPAGLMLLKAPQTKMAMATGPRSIQTIPRMRFIDCIEKLYVVT